MQGDTISYNSVRDTNFNIYCKPNTSHITTKADSLQLQTDSLNYKYLLTSRFKNLNCENDTLPTIALRESMFTTHQLKVKNITTLIRKELSTDWLLLLLLLCFSLLAWILTFSRKRVNQIIKATYTNRTINQLIRDGDLFKERIAVAFIVIYFISISLFVFQATHYYLNLKQFGYYSVFTFFIILAIIIALYILKLLATKFIGFVFKNNIANHIYLLNGFIFNIITGILLLPLLLFMIYSKGVTASFATNLSIAIVLALAALRYLRNIIIGVSFSKFSIFYLFLYLCTLEILPILIIIKVIIGLIDSKL